MPLQPPVQGLKSAAPPPQSQLPATDPEQLIAERTAINDKVGGHTLGQPQTVPPYVMGQTWPAGMTDPTTMALHGIISGLARQDFTHDTGIPPNPAAGDIELQPDFNSLMKRAQAIR